WRKPAPRCCGPIRGCGSHCGASPPAALPSAPMADSFFTTEDGVWFQPTGPCRGPWDPDACHAGPPTGLMARASERLVPDQQLVRLNVDLTRPIPHAGFTIAARVTRAGRTVSTTEMEVLDGSGKRVAVGRGMHVAPTNLGTLPTVPYPAPDLAEARPDRFPIVKIDHGLEAF